MYAINTDFNPRYWIYCTNLGLKSEILRDKDIIWQCVSCNKCTNICPKDVRPEGVMKALAHWLESEGHTPKSKSSKFDEEFTRQCIERGRIEDSEVMFNFFKSTGENIVALVKSGWLGLFIARMNNLPLLKEGRIGAFLARLPIVGQLKMGWAMVFKPRTRDWSRTGEVLAAYVEEQKRKAHAHG
jgi:heterodisulfide reductase subunit C